MFSIQSRDDQASLSFTPYDRDFFVAEIHSRGLSATAQVGLYHAFELNTFFAEIEHDWHGWPDTRTWTSLEEEVEIRATSDRTGHVYLEVILQDGAPARWIATVNLVLEAGQLTAIAAEAKRWNDTVILPAHRKGWRNE